ncbi:MAG: PAS domain-containing sensor histidine kinase [Bacteroidales bacterium]|nr:PAS domain-containing sensor histidine kinase [Bacteroidales bacterium]
MWISLVLATAILLTFLLANRYIKETRRINENKEYITDLKLKYLNSSVLISNFLSIESVNPQFFRSGKSQFIQQKYKQDSLIYDTFNYLKEEYRNNTQRKAAIAVLEDNMNRQELLFTKMVHKVWERGYKDFGLVGRMRRHAHNLESFPQLDKELLLSLRRREKDFIIRHEPQYINNFDSIMTQIRNKVHNSIIDSGVQNNCNEVLLLYSNCFHTLVQLDTEIGIHNNTGLKAELDSSQFEAQKKFEQLQTMIDQDVDDAFFKLKLFFILGTIILFVFCLSISALLSRKISKPLTGFVQHLKVMKQGNYDKVPELEVKQYSYEIKILYEAYNSLLQQLAIHDNEKNILINKLLSSEEKYRNMADRLPQSIFETNSKGQFKYVNSHWKKSFGYKETDLGSKITLDSLIITKKHNREQARINEVAAKRKDGSWFPALLYTDDIIIDGRINGVRGVVIDISDRYRYLKMLKTERKKALAADKLKSAFIANVSHEVRTPLNAVLGYSHLLKDRLRDHFDDEGFIRQIIANGNQLLHLFDDIMDFSLIKTDQFKVNRIEIDVNSLLHSQQTLVSNIRATINKPDLIVNFIKLPNTTFIESDAQRINTIFRHLIQNAFKFTNKGQIDIGAYESEHQLIFFVKDTGMGISKDEQQVIFEPFRQIDEGLARSYQGAGIGLALCKALTTTLDGHIWLVSEPDEGSTFYFSLPIANNQTEMMKTKCTPSESLV